MGTGPIEVGNIGLEDAGELLLMKDQQVIEALTAHAPQKALTVRVGTWRVDRCPQELDPTSARHLHKARAALRIIIADQESRRLPEWRGFPQLLRDPGIGWVASHAHVYHLARLQLNDEKRKH
jgi:hypothetical protein